MKKFISLLTAISFILALVPLMAITSMAATSTSEFSVRYADGGAYIVEFKGSSTSVSIPSTFSSKSLLGIDDMAFASTKVKSVTIPSTVTTIGNDAFANCTSLTYVSLPSSLTTLGKGAFKNCTALESISIPAVDKIDDFTFYGCTSLYDVTLSNGTAEIGLRAFDSCAIDVLDITKDISKIEKYAFMNCTAFESISVDSSNTTYKISNGALVNKNADTIIYVPAAIGSSYVPATTVTTIAKGAFVSTMCSEITLPSSVTTISDRAVTFSTALTKITVPASVSSIGYYAFEYSDDVVICCASGSEAHMYALDNNIPCEFLPGGDVTGDGLINARDAVALRRYMDYGYTIVVSAADMNGDLKVDETDLELLGKYIVE